MDNFRGRRASPYLFQATAIISVLVHSLAQNLSLVHGIASLGKMIQRISVLEFARFAFPASTLSLRKHFWARQISTIPAEPLHRSTTSGGWITATEITPTLPFSD